MKEVDQIKLNDVEDRCDCCNEPLTEELLERPTDNDDRVEDVETNTILSVKILIVIGLVLTATIVVLELILPQSFTTGIIMFVLATPVQFLLGKPFYIRFYRALRNRKKFTTDTLVVLSTSVAYFYSLIILVSSTGTHTFFEASSSVLTIFTIGEYLEGRILKTTSESLKNLLTLKPRKATVIRNGIEISIYSDDILIGDIVVTKPGEKIAADGIVIKGQSSVDESMITGESIPIEKGISDKVIGGTINKNGYIQFMATNVGSMTVLSNIIEVVRKARLSKSPIQRIADKAVQYFIPIVLGIAAGAALYWSLVAHEPISFAVTVFATVLVVSCPCALGIATPMVISLAISKATQHGGTNKRRKIY